MSNLCLKLCAVVLGLSAALPALAAPKPVGQKLKALYPAELPQDLKEATEDPTSVFNNPNAVVWQMGTGGHGAAVVQRQQGVVGDRFVSAATIDFERTDPFKYHQGPSAILVEVTHEAVSPHDVFPTGQSETAINVAKAGRTPVYRASNVRVSESASISDDNPYTLGNIAVATAGKNSTWDSQGGHFQGPYFQSGKLEGGYLLPTSTK